MFERFSRWWKVRGYVRTLGRMEDRLLTDMGIARRDIRKVVGPAAQARIHGGDAPGR